MTWKHIENVKNLFLSLTHTLRSVYSRKAAFVTQRQERRLFGIFFYKLVYVMQVGGA